MKARHQPGRLFTANGVVICSAIMAGLVRIKYISREVYALRGFLYNKCPQQMNFTISARCCLRSFHGWFFHFELFKTILNEKQSPKTTHFSIVPVHFGHVPKNSNRCSSTLNPNLSLINASKFFRSHPVGSKASIWPQILQIIRCLWLSGCTSSYRFARSPRFMQRTNFFSTNLFRFL